MITYDFNPNLPFIKQDWKGNPKIGGEFVSLDKKEKIPISAIAKYAFGGNPQNKEKKIDKFIPSIIYGNTFIDKSNDKIVWLGHSCFYIVINGVSIITDPVFSDLSIFLKRKVGLPCNPNEMKNIDYILLSHGHRDHLDLPSLKILAKNNPSVSVLCPLNIGKIIKKFTPIDNIIEAGWWQKYITENIEISFLPAKHWNRRHLTDYNTTLWGSFMIKIQSKTVYFAGDSAKGLHFEEIQNQFPEIDYALMPVGAYKPSFLMEWAHLSPDEAVAAFHQLGAKHFIPMHYGTFDLSHEPASEPISILKKHAEAQSLNGNLVIPAIGEVVEI